MSSSKKFKKANQVFAIPSAALIALGLVTLGPAQASAGALYKDGTYATQVSYNNPSGGNGFKVTLKLADDKVTSVNVVSTSSNTANKGLTDVFNTRVQSEVVGKPLKDLNVKLVGSSLSSAAFNQSLDKIRQAAKN